jgi:hypothetical protein
MMYYSSTSSSCDDGENDGSEIHLHPIASDYLSLSPGSASEEEEEVAPNSIEGSEDNADTAEGKDSVSSPVTVPIPNNDLSQSAQAGDEDGDDEGENVDDGKNISTLRLEEKIVSLMNRVWILELENDVLRSRWKKEDDDHHFAEDIKNMYQDPYAPPASYNIANNKTNTDTDIDSNTAEKCSNSANSNPAEEQNVSNPLEHQNFGELRGINSENDRSMEDEDLLAQNRSLRTDLGISEEVRERMRVTMVSLESRDKLRCDLIEELFQELEGTTENHETTSDSLRKELESERTKTRQLQNSLEEETKTKQLLEKQIAELLHELEGMTENHETTLDSLRKELDSERTKTRQLQRSLEEETKTKQLLEKRIPRKSIEKECIDGSLGTIADKSSATKAAQLISDLSNELRITMQRESDLKDELEVYQRKLRKHQTTKSTTSTREDSVSPEQHQREKNALMQHNEELESLNIELVRKFVTLETKFNALVEKTKNLHERDTPKTGASTNSDKANHAPRREIRTSNINTNHTRIARDHVHSPSIHYLESQREITSLKARLAARETAVFEPIEKSPISTASRLVPSAHDTLRRKTPEDRRLRYRKSQEEKGASVPPSIDSPTKDKEGRSPPEADFSILDEQREELRFATLLSTNRFEI